jgi:hypothetical protein
MAAFDGAIGLIGSSYTQAFDRLNRIDPKAEPQVFATELLRTQLEFAAASNALQNVTAAIQSTTDAQRSAARSSK